MHSIEILDYKYELKRKKIHLLSFFIPLFYIIAPSYIYIFISIIVFITLSIDFLRLSNPKSNLNFFYNNYLKNVSRSYELNNLLSATILVLISAFIIFLFDKNTAIIGISLASISDSFAAIIGMRYGQIKTFHNKTLEGFVAFFISALFVVGWLNFFININIDIIYIIIICFISSIIESITPTKYDNISVPLGTSLLLSLFYKYQI